MALMFDHFPVFEANQVLTSGHLNDVFNYLDEQTRLSRSHLIGIGIVCGLEIKLDTAGASILLSKGCGVTSQGYLLIEFADISLVSYRAYALPTDLDYPPFKDAGAGTPFPLWELFPAGEPNTTPLNTPADFLDDKAVVLFLELKKQDLRNCSPNNCDDKGAEVTATVRRLLISIGDLDKIIAAAGALGSGLTASDLDAALSAKLNLPDIHALRFDVLNSAPVTSNDVYAGFLNVFRGPKLAQATGGALTAAYAAFKPLLLGAYPSSPFAAFGTSFGFLDNAPASTAQVRFLQYYVDLFEDLLRAYDEFRWKGAELLCVCCPPDGLFPRHLMLGLLHPEKANKPGHYRQAFLSSPAVGCCGAQTRELLQLFSRLVEMAARFSHDPGLPKSEDKARIDPQIRVTPSVLGDRALQARAIPYYYRQNGTPPLYQLWNGEKTRRNRANQNLSYRYDEYNPAGPAFVSDPLRYDIEPYNFLRIEGHLGKAYQTVLRTLLLLKAQYRLPVDIVALRTGPYDDTQPVDVAKEAARFQDLETLYDALREELLSSLAEGAISLYDVPINSDLAGGTPKLPLIKNHEPHYRYPRASVGAFYEAHLQTYQATPYIDVDQTLVSDPSFSSQVLQVYCTLFTGVNDLPAENYAHVVCLFYFSKLAEILPSTLNALGYADFENKYQDLLALVRYFRSDRMASVPADLRAFVPQEELIDQFDQVLFNCMLEAIKAVHDEQAKRLSALRKQQFLATFLQQHPGIQHKAGVPLGGTFIVVYHQEPAPPLEKNERVVLNTALFADATRKLEGTGLTIGTEVLNRGAAATTDREVAIAEMADRAARTDIKGLALTEAINRIGSNKILAENPDINLLLGSLTGKIPMFGDRAPRQTLNDEAAKIIAAAVNELADGTVIADFFLPYPVSSNCPGIEFVLPKSAPSFNADAGCTNSDGIASVTVTAKGGTAPYDLSVDQAGYQALGETLSLRAGTHTLTIRDAEGIESTPQNLVIPMALNIGAPEYACENMQFRATFSISGGTMPYAVNGNVLPGDQNTFITDPAPSGTSVTVVVTDSRNCSTQTSFSHTCPAPCTLPCDGVSLRRGFRFWLPEPEPNSPFREVRIEVVAFTVETSPGKPVDVAAKIVLKVPTELTVDTFPKAVNSWIAQINKIIANEPGLNESGKASWLTLAYESAGAGRLGTLWLEYFECLKFDIRLTVAFVRPSGEERLQVTYSPAGTSILARDVTTTVPPFDGTRIDKCNPNNPPVALCPKTPEITLKVDSNADGRTVRLSVTASPATRGLTFLWEVQDAAPAIGNGDTFTTTFNNFGVKQVTVTAFTRAGCRVTQSTQITIRG